ncbi:MAG: ribonuclease T [Caulobacterales bacterium]|nr:ribonuclease T [Caulobacterales bacterium]
MKALAPLLGSLAIASAATAAAAAPACHPPKGLAPAPAYDPPPGEVVRGVPIAYYLLAITWAPEWRRHKGDTAAFAPELDPEPWPQGFALHGLWPNGAAPPYPRYCRPVGPIPAAVVREMYCRTPSAKLLQHEWAAHGACAWDTPAAYFRQAAALYDRIRLPHIEKRPVLTAGDLRAAFMARNAWLRPEAIYVAAEADGTFSEIRLCFDTAYRPAACPGGNGAPDSQALGLTPSTTRRF